MSIQQQLKEQQTTTNWLLIIIVIIIIPGGIAAVTMFANIIFCIIACVALLFGVYYLFVLLGKLRKRTNAFLKPYDKSINKVSSTITSGIRIIVWSTLALSAILTLYIVYSEVIMK